VVADGVAPAWGEWLAFGLRAFFLAVLVACTFIDIDHRILPDVLTKPAMVLGVLGSLLVPQLAGSFVPDPDALDGFFFSVVGLLGGLWFTWAIREVASRLFRREAMGFGDVKLMGAIGAFLGWDGALISFFLGSLLGAGYGLAHRWITGEGQIFFGPFLAAGAVTTQFFKSDIKTFVTVTWPNWQQEMALPPWVLVSVILIFAALLLVIIRRGRCQQTGGNHESRH
jgi:prepilin signal peptidase PulO-like enzyme (type II secretory pathway)